MDKIEADALARLNKKRRPSDPIKPDPVGEKLADALDTLGRAWLAMGDAREMHQRSEELRHALAAHGLQITEADNG